MNIYVSNEIKKREERKKLKIVFFLIEGKKCLFFSTLMVVITICACI